MRITTENKLLTLMKDMRDAGKRPAFHVSDMILTLAPDDGANPDHLYMKDPKDGEYLGKIKPDKTFITSKAYRSRVTKEQEETISDALHNPEQVALKEGKRTGSCCCCGRTLTNPISVALGIGPICRGEWFPDTDTDTNTDTNKHPTHDLLDLGFDEDDTEYSDALHNYSDDIVPPRSILITMPGSIPTTIVRPTKVQSVLDIMENMSTAERVECCLVIASHYIR